jgi:hypothetical protein
MLVQMQQENSDNMMPNEMTMCVEIVRTEHKLHSNNNKASLNVELNCNLNLIIMIIIINLK